MSLQRNYYEVLGVPQEATTDQIKKKYRELARRFHPDVVKDKDLGQRVFSQINQAYRILADPERRAQYNSALAQGAASSNGASANGASSAAGSQQAGQSQTNGTAHSQSAAPQGQPPSAEKMQAIMARLADADNAIMAGKPVEAGAFCMKVLEIDPRNVRALDILGDSLTQMGKHEDAAVQYRKALQIAPSHSIQAKLNRLDQAAPSTRTRPIEQMPGQTPPPKKPDVKKPDPVLSGTDKAAALFGRFLGKK